MKIAHFHEGDRSEYLAEFALSTIGLCVPVPRPSDQFLTDFIVHLTRPVKMIGKSGREWEGIELVNMPFAVQVKSNDDDIPVVGEEARRLFFRSVMPFFVVLIDKNLSAIRVFHTMHRLMIAYTSLEQDVALRFGGDPFELPTTDGKIKLGPPIYEIALSELDHADLARRTAERQRFREVVESWAYLDVSNCVWRRDHIPCVLWPKDYKTNNPVPTELDDLRAAIITDTSEHALSLMSLEKTVWAYHKYFGFMINDFQQRGDAEDLKTLIKNIRNIIAPLAKLPDEVQE